MYLIIKNHLLKIVVVGVVLLGSFVAKGQSTNFNSSRNWSLHKKEIYGGIGLTQFLGDVGGTPNEGRQKTLIDLDWPATRMGGHIGYRYRFHQMMATKTHLNVGMVYGNDNLTTNIYRMNRNLHFKSIIVELSQHFEFVIWADEQVGRRYRVPGLSGARNKSEMIYMFVGIGVFYYNPKAQYNGDWVALRPLGTEGQNFPDGAKPYGPFSVSIPMGFGGKMAIGRVWKLGIEFTYHKTFTDYIDDVSTVYYDPVALANQNPVAAAVANPTLKPEWFTTVNLGEGINDQRGSPADKDAYFFINVSAIRNITYASRSTGRVVVRWKSVKAKF
jgi:hypothetical protein